MSDLPKGWMVTTLDAINDPERPIRYGMLKPGPNLPEGIPYVKVRDIKDGRILVDQLHRTSKEIEEPFVGARLRSGDLLISIRGTYGRVAPVPAVLEGASITQDSARIAVVGIDVDYVRWYLEGPASQAYQRRVARGVAVKGVNIGDLRKLPVAIPPLPEQARIVEAIEAALSKLDAGSAYLDAAFRRFERAQESIALFEVWDRALELPDTKMVAVGDVADVGSGTTPSRSNPGFWEGGDVPWATSGSVMDGLITHTDEFVTPEALARTTLKVWPRGTLLLAMYGEGRTRGRCAELGIDATCNQACAAIRVRDDSLLLPGYLKLLFDARYRANRLLGGGGVQQNLNQGIVRNIEVPLPALDFQRRAIAAVETQLAQLDAIRRATDVARQRARSLRRAILDAAFSGRLVRHDPTDEPAEQLLERLSAAAPPVRRRGRRPLDAGVPA